MSTVFKLTTARWCFELFGGKWSIDQHCNEIKKIGCTAIDLAPPSEWPAIFSNGLEVTCGLPEMEADIPPFEPGFCNPDREVRKQVGHAIKDMIDRASAAEVKVPYVLVFTGMKVEGVSPEEAVENCVAADGFPEVVKYADRKGVGLVLEALNIVEDPATWRGHPGYYGYSFDYIAEIVRRTNEAVSREVSKRSLGFVLDPYHQVLMGDDCDKIIEQHHDSIDALHLAGIVEDPPSARNRCELDLPGQRVDYRAIAAALTTSGKQNLPVMCEWIPQRPDAREGIEEAAKIFLSN